MAEQTAKDNGSVIRFGILGCAYIARKLSRAISLSPNSVTVAVGSRSSSKAESFISSTGLDSSTVKAHGSYEAVLDDGEVDAVYMPIPTSLHVKWATAAAEKKKHVLLEKPTALNVAELDVILKACEENGVQFMDSTMWMHHPRTTKMKELIMDPDKFGQLRAVHSVFTFAGDDNFFKNDIRVKPDCDALGALGDLGWYCIRSILWTADFELPKTAIAFPGTIKNDAGVILACGGTLSWEDGKVATFHCSFFENLTTEVLATGTRGTLRLSDYVIPFEEEAADFTFGSRCWFKELITGWDPVPNKHVVTTDLPQEACMVREFSRLVGNIKNSGAKPDNYWPSIIRKTQLVTDAVKISIDKGAVPVDIGA